MAHALLSRRQDDLSELTAEASYITLYPMRFEENLSDDGLSLDVQSPVLLRISG
jgi:hypothetical protein